MKKVIILILWLTVSAASAQANKVLLHLQSSDSLVHKSIVNQISNLKKALPDATIELVCHGPGLEFLLKGNARHVNKIDKMKLKDVSFVGCEFTMSQRNYKKEDLVPFAQTVPLGIAEIVKKQADGWLYVKMGF